MCQAFIGVYGHAHAELVQGKRVLELGCGTGLAGIVAAALGASAVLTDTAEIAAHAQTNIDCNTTVITSGHGSAQCAVLKWDALQDSSVLLEQYEVIMGADLVYADKDITPLADTLQVLRQHSPHVKLFLAHKDRNSDITGAMLEGLRSRGSCLQSVCQAGGISIYAM